MIHEAGVVATEHASARLTIHIRKPADVRVRLGLACLPMTGKAEGLDAAVQAKVDAEIKIIEPWAKDSPCLRRNKAKATPPPRRRASPPCRAAKPGFLSMKHAVEELQGMVGRAEAAPAISCSFPLQLFSSPAARRRRSEATHGILARARRW